MTTRSTRISALRRAFLGTFSVPEVPEDLTTLSDDEVGQLGQAIEEAFREAAPQARTAEAVAELQQMADALDRVRAEAARRYEAAGAQLSPEQAAAVQALADRINRPPEHQPADPALEALARLSAEDRQTLVDLSDEDRAALATLSAPPPAPPAPPVVDAEALGRAMAEGLQPLVERLAAQPRRPGLTPFSQLPGNGGPPPAPSGLEPIRPQTAIVAGADIPGFGAGQQLDSMDQVWEAMAERRQMFQHTPSGVEEKHLVARFRQTGLPDDRHFEVADEWANTRKWRAATDPTENQALTASGGLCAPVEPYYDIQVLASAERPLQGAFPTFNASRGGIRLVPPPKLSDASGSVGFITAAVDQAALGGSGAQISAATKPCLHVTCPGPVEYDVAAITKCLEFGNFTTRAYPEQMPAWGALAAAQQAATAETKILDALSAVHVQIPEANVASLSAGSQWLAQVAKYGYYVRNHNRMDQDAPLHVLAPVHAVRLFQADFAFRKWDDVAAVLITRMEIEAYLRDLNINVTWYMDTGTGKGQVANGGAAATAAIQHFPASVVWHLFPEGSWLRLDSGMLDIGIVRDSSLNSLNNFRMFSETFETMAFVGLEGLEVTSPLVATGLTAGTAYGSSTETTPVAIPTTY